jgi:hypothetical protein
MTMWELMENGRTSRHRSNGGYYNNYKSNTKSSDDYEDEINDAYSCGYEEGYKKARNEYSDYSGSRMR